VSEANKFLESTRILANIGLPKMNVMISDRVSMGLNGARVLLFYSMFQDMKCN
jgi:hypothetical protein